MTNNLNLIEQNLLLSQEVKRRVDQMAAINAVAAIVGQSLDLDVTLTTSLQAMADVVGAEASGISLIDHRAGELVLRAQLGWVHDFVVSNPMRIPLGKGMSGQVLNTNDVVVDNDLDGTEDYAVPSFREEHFRSIAMAPMHARGEIIGILSIMSYQPDNFNQDIVNLLRVVADTVGVALGNARLYESTVEQENRLSAILHSTADGIIATDGNSRIQLVNQMTESMLDVSASNLVGVALRKAPIQPQIRDALLMALANRGNSNQFEITLESGRVISGVTSPVYVERQVEHGSTRDGWVIVLQDVTHLKEAEIARAQFIQAAAHDMRNPLSLTQSSLMMLDEMIDSKDETVGEVFKLAMSGVNRLRSLIDDLLHLEHIESGYNLNIQSVNLTDVFYEVISQISPLMYEKSLSFSQEIESDLPLVEADISWIKRALFNYLENAVKYTPEEGDVLLHVYTRDGYLYIEVTDDGPGISPQAQTRVFERFYRATGSEKIPGTGLGLAIVKSVAEAHGGEVYLNSKPGDGSTFGLVLPIHSQLLDRI